MSLKTRARRIEEAKKQKLLAIARVPTSILKFPYSRDLDLQNVSRLKKLFENGQCLPHHPDYSIPAIIDINQDRFTPEWFQTVNGQEYSTFTPPEGFKLVCLRGQHRAKAAEELLYGPVTWLIKIYSSDISDEVRQDFIDKYDSEKPPDDGEFYYHIRLYSGKWDRKKRDAILEDHWWARWRSLPRNKEYGGEDGSKGKREADPLYRLLRNEDWVAALDGFLHIKALLSGLRIGSTGRVITLGHSFEELPSMVHHIATWWYEVFENDFEAMARFDKYSLTKLHGTAPGASEQQRKRLQSLVDSGDILGAFESTKRAEYFHNLCKASQTVLVPSLDLLFQNLQYLETLRNCFTRLVTLKNRSLRSVLRQDFEVSENIETMEECNIQVDESNMIPTHVKDDPFELAYLQLWLFVFRHFVSMPKMEEPKKAGIRRDQADKLVLYNFAMVARMLGFRTVKIDKLLSQDPDISIADDVMVAARQEPEWSYPNRESAMHSIAAIFRSAKRSEIEPGDSYRRGRNDLPRIYGRPYDAHHHQDRLRMFLPYMHSETEPQKGDLSSIFIARSLYSWLLAYDVKTDFSLEVKQALIPLHNFGATWTSPEAQAEQAAEELQLAKDAQTVREKNESLIQNEKELLQKIDQLKGQIDSLNNEGNTLLSEKRRQDEQLSQIKAQIQNQEELIQNIDQLKEKIESLEKERIAVLGEEHRQLLEDKQAQLTENEQLKSRGEEQRQENNGLAEDAARLKVEIKNLENQIRQLVKSLYSVKKDVGQRQGSGSLLPVATALQDNEPGVVEAASGADPDFDSDDDGNNDDDNIEHNSKKSRMVKAAIWEDGQLKSVAILKDKGPTIAWAERVRDEHLFLYGFNSEGKAKKITDPASSYGQVVDFGNHLLLAVKRDENEIPDLQQLQSTKHGGDFYPHGRPYKRVKPEAEISVCALCGSTLGKPPEEPRPTRPEFYDAKRDGVGFVHGNDDAEMRRKQTVLRQQKQLEEQQKQVEQAESSRWNAMPEFPSNTKK